jgi:organic hydroperoxide reductase OsmC/OhrA
MLHLKRWSLTAATIVLISCSPYKKAGYSGGEQTGATENPTETTPGTDNATPEANMPGKANNPGEAQKDNKTFLVLTDEEALHGLKEGDTQTKIVCDRNVGKTNKVITAFCVNNIRPKSLVELQAALGLAFPANPQGGRGNNGANGNGPAYSIQGHSSSLVGKFVSAINPRVILMDRNANDIALGFVRGEQFSEIAVRNPDNTFDFFLVGFKQACNAKPEHCSPGELLTAAVESNWTEFTLYQDIDLKNTIVDCMHCHQPDGPQSQKILRMQELRNPWTHWFRDNTDGQQLIADYTTAWGTEGVGGVPGNLISGSDPQQLENFVRANNMLFQESQAANANARAQQPNEFLTGQIRTELANAANNGRSPTAEMLRQRFIQRKALAFTNANGTLTPLNADTAAPKNYIPIPFFGLKVTEPALQATFTKQIQDFKAGTLTLAQFKDTRDIFPTDQQALADVGFAVAPNETPQNMLALACAQCHHSGLDQSLSRAKFNAVDFTKMANLNAELDIAIARLKLGYTPERLKAEGIKILAADGSQVAMHKGEHLLTMPPRRFKSLTDAQIDSLIKYLESQKKP